MSRERKPRRKRWMVRVTMLVFVACLAMPAWSADRPIGASDVSGTWIGQAVERAHAYWRAVWHDITISWHGAGREGAESINAHGRHHLTIEPGGSAVPPPNEGDGPGQG